MALVDSGADENFISRLKVKEYALPIASEGPTILRTLPGMEAAVYGTVSVDVETTDTFGTTRLENLRPKVIDMPGIDLVLGMPWLVAVDPQISYRTREWRHSYQLEKVELVNKDKFAKGVGSDNTRSALVGVLYLRLYDLDIPLNF